MRVWWRAFSSSTALRQPTKSLHPRVKYMRFNVEMFDVKTQPPTPFGFFDTWDDTMLSDSDMPPWLVHKQNLMRTMQYCVRANELPPLDDADLPSDADLERGAASAFVWLANVFSRTALQLLQAPNQPSVRCGMGVVAHHGSWVVGLLVMGRFSVVFDACCVGGELSL